MLPFVMPQRADYWPHPQLSIGLSLVLQLFLLVAQNINFDSCAFSTRVRRLQTEGLFNESTVAPSHRDQKTKGKSLSYVKIFQYQSSLYSVHRVSHVYPQPVARSVPQKGIFIFPPKFNPALLEEPCEDFQKPLVGYSEFNLMPLDVPTTVLINTLVLLNLHLSHLFTPTVAA